MIGLLFIGYLAGLIAGVSPCILPILPVVLVGWTAPVAAGVNPVRARQRRALAVVVGVVVSFGLITALGSVILSSLGLPQTLLRTVGLVLLVLFGIGLLVPQVAMLMERPFMRLTRSAPTGTSSGFLFGLGLGLVFVPCAGPVLAAISVLGARHHASFYSVVLSLFFAAGAATPLMLVAMAGDRLVERNRSIAMRARRFRPVAGALLILMALAIALNAVAGVQRWLPTYTQSLQRVVESNSFTHSQLRQLSGGSSRDGSLTACESVAAASVQVGLNRCGIAPNFTGITAWLNTPGDQPLSMASLRGRVVLVDFWTYSCINCQRTLPHVEQWYRRYHADGFDVIGVEAPEFAFEHSVSNIRAAAKNLGVVYPIAVDDNLDTWTAYSNEYWPAEYLIDATGVVRHVSYGEGDYGSTESLIRTLLSAARPTLKLPPRTEVPDLTPTEAISPETYLGTDRSQYLDGQTMTVGREQTYRAPGMVPLGEYALSGTWTASGESVTAKNNAQLTLDFEATHVYLVLSGTGTVAVTEDGGPPKVVSVHGFPTLYTLFTQTRDRPGILHLSFSQGVSAYDFTFG